LDARVITMPVVLQPWRQQIEFKPTGPLALHDHELMIEAALARVALAYFWEDRARPISRAGG
jgi:hypothetical protein